MGGLLGTQTMYVSRTDEIKTSEAIDNAKQQGTYRVLADSSHGLGDGILKVFAIGGAIMQEFAGLYGNVFQRRIKWYGSEWTEWRV